METKNTLMDEVHPPRRGMNYGMFLGMCLIAAILFLAGCSLIKESGKEPGKGGAFVYYMNMEGTSLVKAGYTMKNTTEENVIEDMLHEMRKEPESIESKSVFPVGVYIREWVLTDEILDIHFSNGYGRMKPEEEVLLRAAVVLTLSQLKGLEYIDFFIEDEPLTDSMGNAIGYMGAEDFLQYKGSSLHLYEPKKLKLYFANENGNRLISEEVSVRYNSNMSIERLIVEQLIKGPSINGLCPVIPPETKVIGVSVKDTVCYVNLDEGFLSNPCVADPGVAVYAIVNSIVDGGASSQVQISVNGESNIKYMGVIDLSKPLSRDQNLVEESGE